MKHIGIVGVTSEGSALCYKTIISESSKTLGKNKHPEVSLNNQPFDTILQAQRAENWNEVSDILLRSLNKLSSIGADFAIIPANSIHFAIEQIKKKSPITVLDMLEETANECVVRKYKKVGVLGVGITMSNGLYKDVLTKVHIENVTPTIEEQEILNEIIYNELVLGQINNESVQKIIQILHAIKEQGCDAVILGCTELPLVINTSNCPLPFIDTTKLIAERAVEKALED